MIYTPLTKQAMRLCFDAHKEQADRAGMPYVFHPFHLAEQMQDELSVVCALLHDVVEDTDYTFEILLDMGFPDQAIAVLRLLTHDPAVPYFDYIEAISRDPIAKRIKLADLVHNSDLSRIDADKIDEKTLERCEKYKKAIAILTAERK